MIEDELRRAFARHEVHAPAPAPLRRAIDMLAGRRRRRRRAIRVAGVAVVAALAVAAPPVLRQAGLGTEPVVPGASASPSASASARALNLLLINTSTYSTDAGPKQKANLVTVVHVPAGGTTGYLVTLYPDTPVDIPGKGRGTLATAYAQGGAVLTEQAVAGLLGPGAKLDGVAEVAPRALYGMVEQLGTVRVCVPEPLSADYVPTKFEGCQDLGRGQAVHLLTIQEVPGGEDGRRRILQRLQAAVATQAYRSGALADPVRLGRLLATDGLKVGAAGFGLDEATTRAAGVGGGRLVILCPPTSGEPLPSELFTALRQDTLEAFAGLRPDWVLPQE